MTGSPSDRRNVLRRTDACSDAMCTYKFMCNKRLTLSRYSASFTKSTFSPEKLQKKYEGTSVDSLLESLDHSEIGRFAEETFNVQRILHAKLG